MQYNSRWFFFKTCLMRVPSVVFGKMSSTIRQKHYCTVILQFDARCHPIGFFDFAQKRFCRISTQTFDRFSENVSCICRKRERGHGDMSLRARHLPIVRRIIYPQNAQFFSTRALRRRSYAVHNCFVRFFRILSVGHGSQAALSSSAPPDAFPRPAHFPQPQSCAISAVFRGFDVNFFLRRGSRR